MTATSKTKSYYERVLSEIYARRFRTNNQRKCIDCLKPRSNKNKLECMVAMNFMCQLLKFFICNIAHFLVYKNGNIVKN